jgi:hypothetical protein
MKEFDILGTLSTDEDLDHKQMLEKFYAILKANGFHFSGSTAKVKDK